MSLLGRLIIRITYAIVAVMTLFSTSGGTAGDFLTAAYKGFFVQYEAQERAQMMTELLLANRGETFEDSTCEAAKEIIYNVIIQFMTGGADKSAVTDVLDSLANEDIVRSGTKTYTSTFSSQFLRLFIDNINSSGIDEGVKAFLNHYSDGINDLYVYLFEVEGYEGIYEFRGSYVTDDGRITEVLTGVYYDSQTGLVYGYNADGVFGIGFDYDAKQYILENPVNAWMRSFGYNIGFDILGDALFMDCNTVRIRFDYDGRNCMIQLWKGNYTKLTNGAEIGIYYLENGRFINYSSAADEDMLEMRMTLSNGDKELFSREWQRHWWLSGYQPGPAADKDDLILNASIRFENENMARAFAEACKRYPKEIAVTMNGLEANFIWQ